MILARSRFHKFAFQQTLDIIFLGLCRYLTCILLFLMSMERGIGAPLLDPYFGEIVFSGPAHSRLSSIYLNPSAIAHETGLRTYSSTSVRYDNNKITNLSLNPQTGLSTNANLPNLAATHLTHNGFVGVAYNFDNDALTIAVALSAPIAETTPFWDKYARYHTFNNTHYSWFTTLALAYRWKGLGIGLGISSIALSQMNLSFARDTTVKTESKTCKDDIDCQTSETDQNYTIETHSVFDNLTLHFGLTYRFWDNWNIGIGIITPSDNDTLFRVTNTGTADITTGDNNYSTTVDAVYSLPLQTQVAIRAGITPSTYITGGIQMIGLDHHEQVDLIFLNTTMDDDIPSSIVQSRQFKRVYNMTLGLESQITPSSMLGTRFKYETEAVDINAITPTYIVGNNMGIAAAFEQQLSPQYSLSLGYGLTWFPSKTVTDSIYNPQHYAACVNSNYTFESCRAIREGRDISSTNGTYQRHQHAISIALQYKYQ